MILLLQSVLRTANSEASFSSISGFVVTIKRSNTRNAVLGKLNDFKNVGKYKKWKENLLVAASGGAAGGISTALLYPLDTLKTIRQSDQSLRKLSNAFGILRERGMQNIYSGVIPTVLGSMPSSALYFGAYEGTKQWLFHNFDSKRRMESQNHTI